MRKVRQVTAYVCTACFTLFPTSKLAKDHAKSAHPPRPKPARGAPRRTQTGQVLEAVKGGAASAAQISEKTRIPLERVHSLLSYHRRRGNIKGFSGKLKATASAR